MSAFGGKADMPSEMALAVTDRHIAFSCAECGGALHSIKPWQVEDVRETARAARRTNSRGPTLVSQQISICSDLDS
jgi:hypothetical protein